MSFKIDIKNKLRFKVLLIILGLLLIASGTLLAITKFRSSSDNSGLVIVSQEVATESAKVKNEPKKDGSAGETKGTTTTSQTVYQNPIEAQTKKEQLSENNSYKYLDLKFKALLNAQLETNKYLEKANVNVPYFPIPYLDTADEFREKSISYNSKINPSNTEESKAFKNCKDADEHLRLYVIALRGWAYHHLIGEHFKATEVFVVIEIQANKFGDSLSACASF